MTGTGTGAWYVVLGVVLEYGGGDLVLLHCLEVLSGEEGEEGEEEGEEDGLVAVGEGEAGVGATVDLVVVTEVVEEGVEVELGGGALQLKVMEVLEAEQEGGVLQTEVTEEPEVKIGKVLLPLGVELGGGLP